MQYREFRTNRAERQIKRQTFKIKRDQVAYDLQGTFDLNIFENQLIKGATVYRKSFQKDTLNNLFSVDFFVGSIEKPFSPLIGLQNCECLCLFPSLYPL